MAGHASLGKADTVTGALQSRALTSITSAPTASPEEFDIIWFDLAITPDVLYKLKPYQRISQWPGIAVVAHKNKLGQNLTLMRKEFPEDYDFFPATFILPYEMNIFKAQFYKKELSPPKEGADAKQKEAEAAGKSETKTDEKQAVAGGDKLKDRR